MNSTDSKRQLNMLCLKRLFLFDLFSPWKKRLWLLYFKGVCPKNKNKTVKRTVRLKVLVPLNLPLAVLLIGLDIVFIPEPKTDVILFIIYLFQLCGASQNVWLTSQMFLYWYQIVGFNAGGQKHCIYLWPKQT